MQNTMAKAERWPALAEPTPLRRRCELRLTHGIARNHQVMNPSVFGRTEAHMSHGREKEGKRDAKCCRDIGRRQAVLGQAYISSTQSVAVTVGSSVALKSV